MIDRVKSFTHSIKQSLDNKTIKVSQRRIYKKNESIDTFMY